MEIKQLLSFVAIGIFMSGPSLHYCQVEIHLASVENSSSIS
jgi:hypothetical protein